MSRPSKSLAAEQRGVTALEFGLLAAPLCLLLLGFLDLGYQSYVRSVLQGALNDIARTASVENPNLGTATGTVEARINTAIRNRMASLVSNGTYNVSISNYFQFSGVGQPERLINDVNRNGRYDAGDCWQDTNPNLRYDTDAGRTGLGSADDVVFYDVTLTMPRLFPVGIVGGSANYSVNVRSAVRSQPYANQPQPQVRC